ncbi:uncharacterized protein LOC662593 [Tribolium castaneum]|uniref:Uncharacterized protein n=1 Tax=Tribolium castaneum TaxID=7070 RepID=D6X3C3_TRICA|nr:PREDICTED: uncharacterized protein LOC662593 [Tribolium castaneum]EFA10360.1 hypothetical protein TcasGA2_TC012586 [Tribolium castaneum]|eukprot:XP_976427.1 PREDICTED: uncharacterized protein LOC662593 [Tribolium castaneum]
MSRVPRLKTETSQRVVPDPASSRLPRGVSRVTEKSQRNPRSGVGRQLGVVKPEGTPQPGPSRFQQGVFKQTLAKSVADPGKKVRTVSASHSQIKPPKVQTKRGEECVVQQMSLETTVQRCPRAEYIGKTMRGVDVAPSGVARQLELTSQQIDPTRGTESAGVNETVSVTSTLSITSGGKQLKKTYKKQTAIASKLAKKPNLNPHHINRLVKEETEDVENTLKMVPPSLVSSSIDKFPLKKKLQKLRLNAEPVSLLTQSVIHPAPTADEVDAEAPPELMATVMDAVEKGATPDSAPNQIFNSLFPEVHEARIRVSSVAPGPLEDVVVPTDPAVRVVDEALSSEMEEFIASEIQNKQELPTDDLCSENNISATERAAKGENKAPEMFLEGEPAPWEDFTVRKISTLVGGDPIDLLDTSDLSALETSADISKELANGIDYFLDADVVPYDTKIQIRGSKIPAWFPGYVSAFPHLPELVKVTKSPSEVLHAAWKAVQPKVFPDEPLLIV